MTVLFGHPGGSPFSHNAALAHFEAGWLEAFCVPWMPSQAVLRALEHIEPLRRLAQRLSRRHFPALVKAPKIQGRIGEWRRLLTRVGGGGDERLSYEANDWLMRTMERNSRRRRVTAVHAYEDCSLLQFVEAKHRGKACIYDMPIGYYPAWEQVQAGIAKEYADWIPPNGLPSSRYVRPEQKREEMRLADLVLVPSTFVMETVKAFHPEKVVAIAPYGVDTEFWTPRGEEREAGPLRFLYAGQLSLRKGVPLLLAAWKRAEMKEVALDLVGSWQLASEKRRELPLGTTYSPPCSREALRDRFRRADILVLPSYFEGLALVGLEALACGVPVIATASSGLSDVLSDACGRIIPSGDLDALVDALRWFDENRETLPGMSSAARARAEECTWARYRPAVSQAVANFV